MDNMTITYQLARSDVVGALWRRLVYRPRYIQSIGLFLVPSIAGLVVAGPYFYPGVLLAIYAMTRPWLLHRALERMAQANRPLTDSRSIEFSAAGLLATGPDWQIRLTWSHFKNWSEDARYFYLERGVAGLGPLIPKAVMSDDQMARLRQYLQSIP